MRKEKKNPIENITNNFLKTLLYAVGEVAYLTRDVGMPIAVYSAGVALLFNNDMGNDSTSSVAPGLILLGVITQMWVNARENPAKRSDELIAHLREITEMARTLSKKSE